MYSKWKELKEEFEITKKDFYDSYSNSILRHLIFRDKEDNWANFYFDKDIKQVRIVINYQDGTIYSRIDNY